MTEVVLIFRSLDFSPFNLNLSRFGYWLLAIGNWNLRFVCYLFFGVCYLKNVSIAHIKLILRLSI